MYFYLLYNFCLEHFSSYKEIAEVLPWMYTDLHVKCLLFLSNFNQTWLFSLDFPELLKYQFS